MNSNQFILAQTRDQVRAAQTQAQAPRSPYSSTESGSPTPSTRQPHSPQDSSPNVIYRPAKSERLFSSIYPLDAIPQRTPSPYDDHPVSQPPPPPPQDPLALPITAIGGEVAPIPLLSSTTNVDTPNSTKSSFSTLIPNERVKYFESGLPTNYNHASTSSASAISPVRKESSDSSFTSAAAEGGGGNGESSANSLSATPETYSQYSTSHNSPDTIITEEEAAEGEEKEEEASIEQLTDKVKLLNVLTEARNKPIHLPIPLSRSALEVGVIGHGVRSKTSPFDIGETSLGEKDANEVREKERKGVVELEWKCRGCGIDLGKLWIKSVKSNDTLRQELRAQDLIEDHRCFYCAPLRDPSVPISERSKKEARPQMTWGTSWSALVDDTRSHELLNGYTEAESSRPLKRVKATKGNKRSREDNSIAHCDVCQYQIASGYVCLGEVQDSTSTPLLIERICALCHAKYKRCTDCGGRAEPRLGVGKWWLKELFPDHRKSCSFSHRPFKSFEETTVDVWRVSELPQDEMKPYLHEMERLVVSTIMAMVAIPDTIESDTPMCHDFRTAAMFASDGWKVFEPSVKNDAEPSLGMRRYVGMRWHNPRGAPTTPIQSQTPDDIARERRTNVMRKDYTLHSWVGAELELATGCVCLAMTMPRGVGRTYHAQTHVCQSILRRIQYDLIETNQRRVREGLSPYPKVHECWVIHGHNKNSRFLGLSEKSRGMIPLKNYLKKYRSMTNPSHFPPERQIIIPWELLKEYNFDARRFGDDDDLTEIYRDSLKGKKM